MSKRDDEAVERLLERVCEKGLKLTPQRMAIVRELALDTSHPTAQDLYERLLPELPMMSFATVYNTLAALNEAGLCAARALARGPLRFDPNTELHDHAVCDGCGRVIDVRRVRAGASDSLGGFQVRAVECIYRGLCADCSTQ